VGSLCHAHNTTGTPPFVIVVCQYSISVDFLVNYFKMSKYFNAKDTYWRRAIYGVSLVTNRNLKVGGKGKKRDFFAVFPGVAGASHVFPYNIFHLAFYINLIADSCSHHCKLSNDVYFVKIEVIWKYRKILAHREKRSFCRFWTFWLYPPFSQQISKVSNLCLFSDLKLSQ